MQPAAMVERNTEAVAGFTQMLPTMLGQSMMSAPGATLESTQSTMKILEGEMLVSLTWIPIQFTQSVIPIGAAMFVICELLSLPEYWHMTANGRSYEHAEIEEEVEREMANAKGR